MAFSKLFACVVVLALIAVALLALPAPLAGAQATGQGKVEGQVVNGTKDAPISSTAGLTVTLLSIAQGATGMNSAATQTDASGRFAFSNLDTVTTTQYLLGTEYRGVSYLSDVFAFGANQTTVPISLTVYETSTDTKALQVSQTHLIVDVQTRLLDITEVVVVQNASDRTVIGGTSADPHGATLIIPIVAGSSPAQFANPPDADGTTLQGNTVLTYTQRFFPGDHSFNNVVMRYTVPFEPPTHSFDLKLTHDTAKLRLLVADVGETVQASPLSAPTPFLAPGGSRFFQASGDNLKAGTTVSVTLTNLPATVAPPPPASGNTVPAPTPAGNTQVVVGVVVGVAALAALALALYPAWRRRTRPAEPLAEPLDRRTELLQAMADLDDAFEAKEIPEEAYRERRAKLKAELLELSARGDE